jgi:hypothetical protein
MGPEQALGLHQESGRMGKRRNAERRTQAGSVFLGSLGAALLIIAVIGFFLDKNPALIGTFLVLGRACL